MKPITTGTVLVAPPLALAGVLGFTDILEDGEKISLLLDKSKNGRKLITDSGEDSKVSEWHSVAASFLGSYRTEVRSIYGTGTGSFKEKFYQHRKYCEGVFEGRAAGEKSDEFLKVFGLCTRPSQDS